MFILSFSDFGQRQLHQAAPHAACQTIAVAQVAAHLVARATSYVSASHRYRLDVVFDVIVAVTAVFVQVGLLRDVGRDGGGVGLVAVSVVEYAGQIGRYLIGAVGRS